MCYHDRRLRYPVAAEKPDPRFARMLQQAVGGVEGEIRVGARYFFQVRGNTAPTIGYRDTLLPTATEEIGRVEMLATALAVALDLGTAPASSGEDGAADGIGGATASIEGLIRKNLPSGGLAAMPVDPDGVPFDMSRIYATAVGGSVPEGRWTRGPTMGRRSDFTMFRNQPLGDEPVLRPARPDGGARAQ